MEHVFAVTLKAKMARFNHPGVYRANCDFMDFFAIDAIKIHDSRHGLSFLVPMPSIMARSVMMHGTVQA